MKTILLSIFIPILFSSLHFTAQAQTYYTVSYNNPVTYQVRQPIYQQVPVFYTAYGGGGYYVYETRLVGYQTTTVVEGGTQNQCCCCQCRCPRPNGDENRLPTQTQTQRRNDQVVLTGQRTGNSNMGLDASGNPTPGGWYQAAFH